MNSSSKSVEHPLVNGAGVEPQPIASDDPYGALDDLIDRHVLAGQPIRLVGRVEGAYAERSVKVVVGNIEFT